MNKIELLSPAGDLERLKLTLLYGADAVYIGGKDYSLRANANNFSVEEIKEACSFAHNLGKKVYLTLNIVFHNEDIIGVEDYIKKIAEVGIDAFIVSDPFIIKYIKEKYPQIEVHLSTQASVTNKEAAKFYKKAGVDRIVLARELSKNEIKDIIDETKLDIEIFIHGAMCTFYSGRCVLSNHITNRDSNRGGCSQVCRFAFDFPHKQQEFTCATKDLNMINNIQSLIEIKVKSLKVEGRMRSVYYLATVIGTYRKIIDAYYLGTLTPDLIIKANTILERVSNRENSEHYYNKPADETDQYYTGRGELSNQDYLAFITNYDKKTKICTMIQRNYFKKNDLVEIFMPSGKLISLKIGKFYTEKYELLNVARHPEEIIKIKIDEEVEKFSMMRKKV